MRLIVFTVLTAILSSGCVHYRARPIDPPQLETEYRNRSLDDAGVQGFVRSNSEQKSAAWPPKSLNLELLTLIAFYYSPDLEVARAGIALADAEIVSARARINPSLGTESGYNSNPESARLYSILPSFTIETAGKRGSRILQAQKVAEAARISLSETAWHVRSRIRAALMVYLLARLRYDQLRNEESIRVEIVEIFVARLVLGEAARPELDVFRINLISSRAALKAAEGEVAQSLAALASAAGLPFAALEGKEIDAPVLEKLPAYESLSLNRVQRAGLVHRADVRRTLVEYAAAEAALRLEVARQYPDIELAPGYSFEEGFSRYVIGATLGSVPLFHRNQGPIAVAEAQRRQVEARFTALQSQVIGEMDKAVVQYRAAFAEFREATDRLITIQKEREEAARRAFAAGQQDRLELATVRLQSATAARSRLEALARAQAALGALEDALQYPLESGLPLPEPPQVSPNSKGGVR
jgi:outer membrane protein TolC